MNSEEKITETHNERVPAKSSKGHLVLALVMLGLLIATAVYVNHIKKTTDDTPAPATPAVVMPSFFLSPAKQALKVGDRITVSVWEDSGSQAVNAVQTSLTYSSDDFTVTDIDASASPFDVESPVTNVAGSLILARGYEGKLTGRQLVAKVTFEAMRESKSAKIDFAGKNVLATAADSKDILKDKTGGVYSIGAKE